MVHEMGRAPSWLDSRAQLTFMASLRLVMALLRWSTAFFRKDTLQGTDTTPRRLRPQQREPYLGKALGERE